MMGQELGIIRPPTSWTHSSSRAMTAVGSPPLAQERAAPIEDVRRLLRRRRAGGGDQGVEPGGQVVGHIGGDGGGQAVGGHPDHQGRQDLVIQGSGQPPSAVEPPDDAHLHAQQVCVADRLCHGHCFRFTGSGRPSPAGRVMGFPPVQRSGKAVAGRSCHGLSPGSTVREGRRRSVVSWSLPPVTGP
ncbi:hypothetical protein ABZ897_03925 [Nonomuraea sp. NPDC046802]|uniref:hypothetical protein n=1 Tax=Nonomuraea sp. NPDC046802 TaxID=3154919 RepID=UPI0033CDDFD5